MVRRFIIAALLLALPTFSTAADLVEGNYRLGYGQTSTVDSPAFIIKVEKKDGKYTATEVDAGKGWAFDGIKVDGDKVHIDLNVGGRKLTFDGIIGKDNKRVLGSFGDEQLLMRGFFVATTADKVGGPNPNTPPQRPEPLVAAQKLTTAMLVLQNKIRMATEAEEKAELTKQLADMRKDNETKIPALYKEAVDKHANSPYAAEAALFLLRGASRNKASVQDVGAWVKIVEKDAADFGPVIVQTTVVTLAELTAANKEYASVALEIATKASSSIKDSDSLNIQARVLKALKMAQTAAGKADDAKATDTKLAKIETALDQEYAKKVPPFKPTPYAGRKDGANRVAVMELFTGAQCPPCVAADVAFDALEKAYKPSDLVLIQYHMHIPGPDPLTNLDSIARWDYYREKFGNKIGGTPTTLFNGTPEAPGGGGMANAKAKYDQYSKIIDPLLEEKTTIKFDGSAKATGDKIAITVSTSGVTGEGEYKLRLLLVEESIRYVGGNGLRFHHQVVRALPGGAAGVAVKDGAAKQTVDVDLKELRTALTKYLDDFAKDRPFPNADRPMDFKHLKVIAIVQDDKTREIKNAVEMEVK